MRTDGDGAPAAARRARYRGDVPGRYEFQLPERRPRDGWFRLGGVDVTTTAFLVGLGVVSMFAYAVSPRTLERLAFLPTEVRAGEVWRLVTWPVATDPSIWAAISLVFFWVFGHRVEEMTGRVRFTRLVAILVVLPPLVVTLLGMDRAIALGIGMIGTAMLVIFAADQPNAPFFFGIPAWVIAAVFVALDVLQLVGDRIWGSLVQLLLTVVLALVVMRQFGHLADTCGFIPQVVGNRRPSSRGAASSSSPAKRKKVKQGRDFDRVVSGPWNAPSAADQAEMDRLLDKMNSVGLSDAERKRLSELGRKLRGG
jgi:membrane associated rhomboid family serine protease